MAAAYDSRWGNEWEGEIAECWAVEGDACVEVGGIFEGSREGGVALSIEEVGEVCEGSRGV